MNPLALPDNLLSRVEDAGINASAPPQQRWVDGWLLRFSPGKAKRARCVQAVADGRLPLDERLALCAQVFQQAGLPMVIRLTPFSRPDGLDAALAARGYGRLDDTRVMVAPRLPTLADLKADPLPTNLQLQPLAAAAFAETVGTLRGSPAGQRAAQAQRLALSPVPYQGWVVRRLHDGAALACGQTACEACNTRPGPGAQAVCGAAGAGAGSRCAGGVSAGGGRQHTGPRRLPPVGLCGRLRLPLQGARPWRGLRV